MMHTPILTVLLPLIVGFILLIVKRYGLKTQQVISLLAVATLIFISIFSFIKTSTQGILVYSLGNWEAPFGIVLVLDQFSILMVLITSLLAFGALWYAISEDIDKKGAHFHPLYQLQLFGINGAFLTGDLFNLFVFFEILLLASYSLLLHGQGEGRTKAGLHYVILNLVGSTLFLFAVGTLYGILGTLNIADMAQKVATLSPDNVGVVAAAGLLLLVVFGLKAAMFPLYLWLPNAYGRTSAPIAALFAIMTKVGIYSIIRVHGTIFGANAQELAFYHTPWVLYIGLITLILATFGVLSAKEIRNQIAYLVLVSVSILLVAIGINSKEALSGAIYYMIHSTLLAGGFFLVADIILKARTSGCLETRMPIFQKAIIIGSLFFVFAIALAGLPPLSGFFGKIMILNAAIEHKQTALILTTILVSSLLVIVALAKSGTTIFYDTTPNVQSTQYKLSKSTLASVFYLFAFAPILVIFANPMTEITNQIATNLFDTTNYLSTVLNLNARP
ncbi:monovalent cation/H+ antiporter subunit D [Arcobacter aquimarinus]|uniref:Multisubunit sodium:proton antiporter, MnhD subunit n=1 Tax=Arcobacter aquimarinus TaxID=1315211 RepID=A0AAE7B6U4_9BACT|nr:monovalent cation/H+ antiporter subunit D [Arcobacter aquimarinus]QKE26637.1 multisubunit sodium:proton antiporter, MnhD subunit [Arcobacter aquimarinus]RXI33664.1 monovalent cation/H+ antiporter subunit D [Arcobacter aquimarinus]